MAALEANKHVKASYDPCDDSCEDQRPRREAPYRVPEAPQSTLAERLERLEALVEQGTQGGVRLQRDVAWLVEHWHQAIDRANEQLGDGAHRLHPVWYWACGVLAGAGIGLLARGCW
jgi:hypothetical protein